MRDYMVRLGASKWATRSSDYSSCGRLFEVPSAISILGI